MERTDTAGAREPGGGENPWSAPEAGLPVPPRTGRGPGSTVLESTALGLVTAWINTHRQINTIDDLLIFYVAPYLGLSFVLGVRRGHRAWLSCPLFALTLGGVRAVAIARGFWPPFDGRDLIEIVIPCIPVLILSGLGVRTGTAVRWVFCKCLRMERNLR